MKRKQSGEKQTSLMECPTPRKLRDSIWSAPSRVVQKPSPKSTGQRERASSGSPVILALALGPFKRRFMLDRPVIGLVRHQPNTPHVAEHYP